MRDLRNPNAPLLLFAVAATASGGSCLAVAPGAARRSTLALPPGGALLLLAPGEAGDLGLSRYAERSFPIGRVTGATPTIVRIPADRSTVP